GFAGILFPAALLILGWNRFWGKELEFLQTKLIGFALLVITAPPLLDLGFGKVWIRGALLSSGGYLGSETHRAAAANLNRAGAAPGRAAGCGRADRAGGARSARGGTLPDPQSDQSRSAQGSGGAVEAGSARSRDALSECSGGRSGRRRARAPAPTRARLRR